MRAESTKQVNSKKDEVEVLIKQANVKQSELARLTDSTTVEHIHMNKESKRLLAAVLFKYQNRQEESRVADLTANVLVLSELARYAENMLNKQERA